MGTGNKGRYAGLFGLGRQLGMDKDALYAQVYLWTGKDNPKRLDDTELHDVEIRLGRLKDSSLRCKRTDVGGRDTTIPLRRKVYMLTETLGWNNDNRRINAFCLSKFGVARLEWMLPDQLSDLINMLRPMAARGYRRKSTQ